MIKEWECALQSCLLEWEGAHVLLSILFDWETVEFGVLAIIPVCQLARCERGHDRSNTDGDDHERYLDMVKPVDRPEGF